MARTSLAAVKAELFDTLDAAVTDLTFDEEGMPFDAPIGFDGSAIHTFPYLPALGELVPPACLCVWTRGVEPEFWLLGVRLYVLANDVRTAQDSLDVLMPAVEGLLPAGYGPSRWTVIEGDDLSPYWAATLELEVGREDYF